MNWILWSFLALVFIVIEILFPSAFYFLCLGIAAIITAIIQALYDNPTISWIVFAVSSITSISLSRPFAKKFTGTPKMSNVDALINQKALVIEDINPKTDKGLVKIEGEIWKAKSDDFISKSSYVEIIKVEGVHLFVKKVDTEVK